MPSSETGRTNETSERPKFSGKKLLLGLLGLVFATAAIGWLSRESIILYVVSITGKTDVGPNQQIAWGQGPETATLPASERPPNIIFILLDDLGINDLSTFGGGVAGGRLPTANIDKLAADGATFSQAYAGTGTCALPAQC